LLVFSRQAIHLLYGGKYSTLNSLIPFVALSSILGVAAHGPGAGLRAVRSPSSVFVAFCAASAISAIIGIPVTLSIGLPGTVATLVLANTVALVLVLRMFHHRTHSSPDVALRSASSSIAIAAEK
jgi:O-antigen/teichoic acid export membrane protein